MHWLQILKYIPRNPKYLAQNLITFYQKYLLIIDININRHSKTLYKKHSTSAILQEMYCICMYCLSGLLKKLIKKTIFNLLVISSTFLSFYLSVLVIYMQLSSNVFILREFYHCMDGHLWYSIILWYIYFLFYKNIGYSF